MTSILILNGPNLNLLGTRQPEVYGKTTLADVEALCREKAKTLGFDVAFEQSNHEGALIDLIHAAKGKHAGIVPNAGAYTHTSIALMDAIASVDGFGLNSQARGRVSKQLMSIADMRDASERAWAYRRIMDSMLNGQMQM